MMRFRLFGIPFEVAGYFWIGSLLLGGLGGGSDSRAMLRLAVWVACVFVSIVVHELGHALVGRHYGAEPRVLLHGIGGLTFLPGARLTRARSILVSLAGPAFGFGLWGLTKLATRLLDAHQPTLGETSGYIVIYTLAFLLYINLVWTLYNLLPILPLDGGQVFRELLGPKHIRITRWVGAVLAAGLCVLSALNGQYFIALFMGVLAYTNFRGETRSIPGGVEK
jgi:stage IV sporulation protein FB